MRILLSAYSCEPGQGSEPGVGWNWALNLQQKGHDVVVLTRRKERGAVEKWFALHPDCLAPEFAYFDLPSIFLRLMKVGLLPVQLYYGLWQILVLPTARRLAARRHFDLVWHVTFASFRQPSVLWRLGVPFVFGPVGGGESVAGAMRADYPTWGHLKELARDVFNQLSRFDPLLRRCFARALLIFVTTPETRRFVPSRCQKATRLYMAIGVNESRIAVAPLPFSGEQRFLCVGRMVCFKGVTLVIRAFAEFCERGGGGRLTLVGKGPEEARCRRLADALGVGNRLDWVPWLEQSRLWTLYREHSVFVFPSLHDSSGNVVVEAMAQGLPVICFDLGGPKEIVTPQSGVVVATRGLGAHAAARAMGQQMRALADDPALRLRLAEGALARAREFTWSARIDGAMGEVEAALSAVNVAGRPRGKRTD